MISRRLILLKNGTLPSVQEETRFPPPQGFFSKHKCQLYLKQSLTPPQCKTIATYRTLNHRVAIEIGRWMTIPISRDTRLCLFFCSYNIIENEPRCVLECFPYNLIRDMFTFLLFENVFPRSTISFSQLDH